MGRNQQYAHKQKDVLISDGGESFGEKWAGNRNEDRIRNKGEKLLVVAVLNKVTVEQNWRLRGQLGSPLGGCWQRGTGEWPEVREWQEVGSERELIALVGISTLRDGWSWDGSEQRTDAIWFFFFWLCHAACGILVPWPGMKPRPPAVEVWSFNQGSPWHIFKGLFCLLCEEQTMGTGWGGGSRETNYKDHT